MWVALCIFVHRAYALGVIVRRLIAIIIRPITKKEYMTKAEVVKNIADTTGLDRQEVLQVVEAFMDTVKNAMSQGDNVYLRGFGSFVVKERAEKTARNISKQTTIIVPARKVPTFKPSKAFTAMIK